MNAKDFVREFPYGWLQLDRINFMAPDPDRYPLYEKKRISEDMINAATAAASSRSSSLLPNAK